MAVASGLTRWDALAAARTRGDVGEGIASVLALLGRADLISFAGGFPDPETFPRERVSALLQEFATAGEASAFQYAPTRGLAGPLRGPRRPARAAARPPARRRRAADHERRRSRRSSWSASRTSIRATWSSSRRPTYLGAIQAFRSFEAKLVAVPMDEHGLEVDELERLLAGGLRPKLVYSIPDHQNPAGVSLCGRAARAARRARAPLRVPDRRGRRLPRARLRRVDTSRASGASARTSSSRRGRRRRRCFPGSGSAGRSARRTIAARLVSAKQNTDQCAGALGQRLFEESARRGWIDEQLRAVARAVPAEGRAHAGGARALDAGGGALDDAAAAASSPG